MKKVYTLSLFLLVISISPCWAETYEQWVSNCRSYKDVAEWLNENFLCDGTETHAGVTGGQNHGKGLKAKSGEETFRSKTGGSLEAALFAVETLNRINRDYRARIIHLLPEKSPAHYTCGFYLGGKLFILDYGTRHEKMIGTHGPFKDLDEYVRKFYLKNHPLPHRLQSYNFGWPASAPPKQHPPAPKPYPTPIYTTPP